MSKRWVSWAAVSSLPQAKKISLHDQLKNNQEHIKTHGGRLVAELTVPGESRDIVLFEDACQRIEAYAQLRKLIDDKAFDVLVCLNRSRLGRTMVLAESIAELSRRIGAIVYETENPPATLEPSATFDSLLTGALKSAAAQNEIQQLIKRNAMGMYARVKSGKFYNNVPYGWNKVYDDNGDEQYELDAEAVDAINLMVTSYLDNGMGTQAICDLLAERGYASPTNSGWSRQTIQYMLKRAWVYAGYTEINRNSRTGRPYARFPGAFPAIITEEQAEAILEERNERINARRSVQSHLFSRMIWCDICDVRVVGHRTYTRRTLADGTERKYEAIAYRCPTTNKHAIKHIRESKIKRIVRRAIRNYADPDIQQQILAEQPDHAEAIKAEIDRHNERLQNAERQIERADDAFVSGAMDRDRYQRQIKRLTEQMEGIQSAITECQDRLRIEHHVGQLADRLDSIAGDGLAMLNHEDTSTANAWLRRHLRIHITPDGIVVYPR